MSLHRKLYNLIVAMNAVVGLRKFQSNIRERRRLFNISLVLLRIT